MRRHHSLLRRSTPIITTAVYYALFYLISAWQFNIAIAPKSVPFDFLLQLIIAYTLFALSRRLWVFVVIHGLLMALLYIGNAVKISFFGGPIMPDDVFALRSLLLILEGWHFIAAAIPLAAIAALLLFNIKLRNFSAYLATMVIILFSMILVYEPSTILSPLDKKFGNSVWDQRSNYLHRGATLYSIQEGARYFAYADTPPDRDLTIATATRLQEGFPVKKDTNTDAPFKPRNVHIVLLESFFDPYTLKKARYSQDPFSPALRKLWKRTGNSHALSPVFGGYTANAEFEILCGFPVVKDSVKFERQMTNHVPCLPHVLKEHGYRTLASHPNVPVFWNRVNAYQRMGFDTYWSLPDFIRDDMNREFLSDVSLYRQVFEKIDASTTSEQPILNYIVTYFGHWSYPLSESRPSKISSTSEIFEVTSYANTVYYKSRELMDFVTALQKRDPESLIVLFGDHLPFMGENFAAYAESGTLAVKRSEFTSAMFKYYNSTPLIIIDGKRGPLKVGDLPLYQVPGLLLKLLDINEPTIMDYTQPPKGMRVRPLPGLHYNLYDNGKIEVCKEPPYTASCETSSHWLDDVLTINNDLFIGQQFTRQFQQSSPNQQPTATLTPNTAP